MPGWGELQVDQLRYMAREHGPAVAYRNLDAGTSITFAEWDAESNRLAHGLVELGVAKGERVSIYLPSDEVLRWIVAYAAIHKAGAVVVPTNTRLSARELQTVLGHAEIAAMITSDALLTAANEARALLADAAAPRERLGRDAGRRRLRHPGAGRAGPTSRTSCTRRGRPGSRRGSRCGTATWP